MPKTHRVFNLTRNFRLKLNQAERAIEACSAVWVEHGVSIRDATLAEAITLRNEQAGRREPLAHAELPGLIYQPNASGLEGYRRERQLASSANAFAEQAAFSR